MPLDLLQPSSNSTTSLPPHLSPLPHPLGRPVRLDLSHRGPIPTNNPVWGNLLLGEGHDPVFTVPYAGKWDGRGWGVSCPREDQKVWGPPTNESDPTTSKYFWTPFTASLILTSPTPLTNLTVYRPALFSASVSLSSPSLPPRSHLRIPLYRGAGFITGVYTSLRPMLASQLAIHQPLPAADGTKQRVHLNDEGSWLVYSFPPVRWVRTDAQTLAADVGEDWSGVVQVAKLLKGTEKAQEAERVYDVHAGVWAEDVELRAEAVPERERSSYSFLFRPSSPSPPLLLHLLPHHVHSLPSTLSSSLLPLSLPSPSNGPTRAFSNPFNALLLDEPSPSLPSLPFGPTPTLALPERAWLHAQVKRELEADWLAQARAEQSFYFYGKLVDRMVGTCWVAGRVLGDASLAEEGIGRAVQVLREMLEGGEGEGKRAWPLVYDTTFGGVCSSAAHRTGDPHVDFGASYYNDPHFHHAYPLHAGALLLSLRPSLAPSLLPLLLPLQQSTNSPISSPSALYPAFRAFDWWVGHGWARGLFPSADGKDEESTSEGAHFFYAAALLARVAGDGRAEELARLQLEVLRRSTRCYRFLGGEASEGGESVMPERWRGNPVGMCFEGKRDYSTWFSPLPEAIHGIHVLPITPLTAYLRPPAFAASEWSTHTRALALRPTYSGWDALLRCAWACASGEQGVAEKTAEWLMDCGEEQIDPGLARSWGWACVAERRGVQS